MKYETSYPNQQKVYVHKRKWDKYMMIGLDEIRIAACNLTGGGLKLYLYLAENVDNYDFWLSPKDFIDKYKTSKSTYDRAKAELKEKGYLSIDGQTINFYANPEDNIQQKESMEELKEQLNLLGNKLEDIDETLTDKYYKRLEPLDGKMTEKQKYEVVSEIIKDMQEELDNIYKKKKNRLSSLL